MNIKIDAIKNILLKAIRICLAITLFTPLVLGPFGISLDEYPKAVFFRLIIEFIFILYVFLLLLDKKYLPKISPLLISVVIFDAIIIISSIFGINFHRSFFGDMQRGEGIVMHLHLLAYFIILIGIFKEKNDWLDLFKISVFISGISSVAAILQQLNIVQFFNVPPRLSGTLSNPDLFGSYIALSVFMAIFLYVLEEKKIYKVVWLFLAALNCYTLFFSATRGAMFGAGLGFALIAFSIFFKLNFKKRITILLFILILCIFILILSFYPSLSEKMPGGSVTSRFTEFNLNGRENIWKIFPSAFMAKPFLGWGFESFTFISDKYMALSLVNNVNYVYDRPHNKIFEVLLYSGIIGLLSYLSIFLIIFYLLLKYRKTAGGLVLFAFFLCYFFQNTFLFDTTVTYILFFLMAGFVNNNFYSAQASNAENTAPANTKKALALKIFLAVFAVLLMLGIMYEVNIKPIMAAMYFDNHVNATGANAKQIFYGYKKAIGMHTVYDSDLMLAFAERSLYILENNYAKGVKQEIVDELIKIKPFLYKNIKNRQQVNTSYQMLARIEEQKYILNKNQKDLDEMEKIIKQAASFNPTVSTYYNLTGELEILKNDYKDGENNIKKSCALDKCQDDQLYMRMGSAYAKKGDVSNEVKNFQKVLDIYYNYQKQKSQFAVTSLNLALFVNFVGTKYCLEANDLQDCKKVYEKGINALPEYADVLKQRMTELIGKSN